MNSSKKILFLSIAFFVILGSFAQDIPQNIKSTITKNHFRIPGTKLFITKPASFSYIKDIDYSGKTEHPIPEQSEHPIPEQSEHPHFGLKEQFKKRYRNHYFFLF